MLTLLKIRNIALIDELSVEFGSGLNLLTGETGSGKSIIVDSLAALTGTRVSSDLIKEGESTAQIEGLFSIGVTDRLAAVFEECGIDIDADENELIVRRELSQAGKNRVFVNNQLVTQGVLKQIGAFLVDIHGQGEQASLYDVSSHVAMLDEFAGNAKLLSDVADSYEAWASIRSELASLKKDESEKLQLLDILRFQVDEIKRVSPQSGEDDLLEEEKRRLNNIEKLSSLSEDTYKLLYDNDDSTTSTLERAARKLAELAEFDSAFNEYDEGLRSAQAVIEELAITTRDFRSKLEFSPERLNEIEDRLAELTRLKRKYGESIEAILEHLNSSEQRLQNIETAEFREEELKRELAARSAKYVDAAQKLHDSRVAAGKRFSTAVEIDLKDVALDKAKFEVRVETDQMTFTETGFDRVEFYFSANPGESPKPLAKVASGGEASRLMLILNTVARSNEAQKSAVFDEIDIGIGGRVAEAVGRKLKNLSANQQVLCVTHQPQIASLADRHFVVDKDMIGKSTNVSIRELTSVEQVEEIARMLAGEQITEAARENARTMLAGR
ncbi:MAG: DNA repair protein RecN [Acidobacteria bacterium]|nr:DNA repair protein RecN [Acidobacteriota bacterium]